MTKQLFAFDNNASMTYTQSQLMESLKMVTPKRNPVDKNVLSTELQRPQSAISNQTCSSKHQKKRLINRTMTPVHASLSLHRESGQNKMG